MGFLREGSHCVGSGSDEDGEIQEGEHTGEMRLIHSDMCGEPVHWCACNLGWTGSECGTSTGFVTLVVFAFSYTVICAAPCAFHCFWLSLLPGRICSKLYSRCAARMRRWEAARKANVMRSLMVGSELRLLDFLDSNDTTDWWICREQVCGELRDDPAREIACGILEGCGTALERSLVRAAIEGGEDALVAALQGQQVRSSRPCA